MFLELTELISNKNHSLPPKFKRIKCTVNTRCGLQIDEVGLGTETIYMLVLIDLHISLSPCVTNIQIKFNNSFFKAGESLRFLPFEYLSNVQ